MTTRYACRRAAVAKPGIRAVFRWPWANARGGSNPLSRIEGAFSHGRLNTLVAPWLPSVLSFESAAAHQAPNGCHQLLGALFLLGVRASDDAVMGVVVQESERDLVERRLNR